MAIKYADYENGNDGNDGSSFAQRVKTIDRLTTLMSPGDTGRIMGSPAPTSLGQNTTWFHTNHVTLANAVTTTIADCETAWTSDGGSNVTCTTSATRKEGSFSASIAIGGSFTTGRAAHFATGTLDLSAYQQVTFWIQQTSGITGSAGAVRLQLCTDTVGLTPVHNIDIPNLVVNNRWVPVTVDLNTNLNSAIQSIRFDVVTDNGPQTYLLDCILAAKDDTAADSLTLTSMIGHSDSIGAGGFNSDTWYGIASINGTAVELDNANAATPLLYRGWSSHVRAVELTSATSPIVVTATNHGLLTGDTILLRGNYSTDTTPVLTAANGSFTVTKIDDNTFSLNGSVGTVAGGATGGFWTLALIRTGWKRETIKTTMVATAGTTVQSISKSGSSGLLINISGGWDRSSMTTQDGETWFSGQNGFGVGILSSIGPRIFYSISKVALTRYDIAISLGTGTDITIDCPAISSMTTRTINSSVGAARLTLIFGALVNNGADTNTNLFGNPFNGDGCFITAGLIANNLGSYIFGGATAGGNNDLTVGTFANNAAFQSSAISSRSVSTFIGVLDNTAVIGLNNYANLTITIASGNNPYIIESSSGVGVVVTLNSSVTFVAIAFNTYGEIILKNSYIIEPIVVTGLRSMGNGRLISHNHQGVIGSHRHFCDGGNIRTDTTIVDSGSTKSWKISPTSSNRTSTYPLTLSLAKIAVNANRLVTVTARVYRDNTGITARLVCKGGQINGVYNDVASQAVGSAGSWETVSISFTPTAQGVVEIIAEVYGGTTYNAYYDTMTLTQV